MATLFLIIRDERVSEILSHRPGKDWERYGHQKVALIDSGDPQFKDIKVGSFWPDRENRFRIEALKKSSPEEREQKMALFASTLGPKAVEIIKAVLEKESISE